MTFAIRFAVALVMSSIVLGAKLNPFLLAIEDLAAFVFWCAGFFGNTIVWRGRRYKLLKDGRFELISEA